MSALLYSIVQKDTLISMINTFSDCIGLPVQVIDENGQILYKHGIDNEFCHCFQKYLPEDDRCEQFHITASKWAISYGGTYIFSCHADLNHIAFPLLTKSTFLGSILVGPFLMEESHSILISNIVNRYGMPIDDSLNLYDKISRVPQITASHANQISNLLYYLFYNLITESKDMLRKNNQTLIQQSKINESIQKYKIIEPHTSGYPYEIEKELITKVKIGNSKEAKSLLNNLLGYILLSEGNRLEIVKNRAVELCSILSREAVESGTPADNILKINNRFLEDIQCATSMNNLCYTLQQITEQYSDNIFKNNQAKNPQLIKKALIYIADHYNRPLTLNEVAEYVHLNPSYFSKLFKSSTGNSFKEHLNAVRIEESKRLLENTDYSIIDISVAVGFDDQSYFSKVFKKHTGMTPKQYR